MNNIIKIALFSRDNRSFHLFRKSWVDAITDSKIPYSIENRQFGFFNILKALIKFIREYKSVRIIFGTSEICLYTSFSSNRDIFVFTGIGRLLQYPGIVQKIIVFILKFTYRYQKIVALNPNDMSYLESIFPTKVILINGEGFNFNNTSPIKKDNSSVFVIAYVGRLIKSKGVERLIEAFIRLTHLNCELHLIGDFDFSNSDAISEEWLGQMQSISNNKIKCYGFVNNVRDLLKQVDIYVSLSDREGLPFSVLEAIEAGCFIVLSPVPGHLSFADLDGIAFDGPKDLKVILEDIIINPIKYYNFDASERIRICDTKFGIQSVVSEIKNKLF
jgi:glycosyltransferase involved in cell wall biosynthesis